MKKSKLHVLYRTINENKKGLFINYGPHRIRRIPHSGKSRFRKGDEIEIITDDGYDNMYKVTKDWKYFETWRIPTNHIMNTFLRKTREDEKGQYVIFRGKIFRSPRKRDWLPGITCFRYVSPKKIEENPGWPIFEEIWKAK
jgi:hypothetical protein